MRGIPAAFAFKRKSGVGRTALGASATTLAACRSPPIRFAHDQPILVGATLDGGKHHESTRARTLSKSPRLAWPGQASA